MGRYKHLIEAGSIQTSVGEMISSGSEEDAVIQDPVRKDIESHITNPMKDLFKYTGSDPEKMESLETEIKTEFPECIIFLSQEESIHVLDALHCMYSIIDPNDSIPVRTDSRIGRDQMMRECYVIDCHRSFVGDHVKNRSFSYDDRIPFNNAQYFGFLTLRECIRPIMMYVSSEKTKDDDNAEDRRDHPMAEYLPFVYIEPPLEI